ncbi:hypothetical protein CG479_009260 [Bacillus cytotoxicus]|nr:hypothetical protein CG479_009260 [Bacillus cytotoxicus]
MLFGLGIRKYISFATEDEKEHRKLKTMFSIIAILSCYAATMLFFYLIQSTVCTYTISVPLYKT